MLSYKQRRQLLNIAERTERVAQPTDGDTAFTVLMRICRDYAEPHCYPLIDGEDRDKWLIERLKNYRIKFFNKI